jgi:hypothetical protein
MASITTTPAHGAAAHVTTGGAAALARPRRAWAWAGVWGGVAGLVAFLASGSLVVDEDLLADNAAVLAEIADRGAFVWLNQVTMSVAALGLVIFGAGLRRRLDEQEPVGSLAGACALIGTSAAAVMALVGGGIGTELFWQLQAANDDITSVDPDTVMANLAIYNTMGWVWAGVGLAAGAVAVAGLRHDSVGRKLAWFSAVMAALVALVQVVPLQYLAAFPAALWCIVTGIAMARRPAHA